MIAQSSTAPRPTSDPRESVARSRGDEDDDRDRPEPPPAFSVEGEKQRYRDRARKVHRELVRIADRAGGKMHLARDEPEQRVPGRQRRGAGVDGEAAPDLCVLPESAARTGPGTSRTARRRSSGRRPPPGRETASARSRLRTGMRRPSPSAARNAVERAPWPRPAATTRPPGSPRSSGSRRLPRDTGACRTTARLPPRQGAVARRRRTRGSRSPRRRSGPPRPWRSAPPARPPMRRASTANGVALGARSDRIVGPGGPP